MPKNYLKNLSENSTDELLGIIARVTASMLRHLDVPENDVIKFTEQVKERKMAELFENFVNDVDMAGRLSDLEKAASDAAYRNKLYQETGL